MKKSPSPNPQAPASLSVGRTTPAKRPTRQLTDEAEADPQDELLESLPESKRADTAPASTGRQAPEITAEDDDDEGRSETELLVDEGAEQAARDQAEQARKSNPQKNR